MRHLMNIVFSSLLLAFYNPHIAALPYSRPSAIVEHELVRRQCAPGTCGTGFTCTVDSSNNAVCIATSAEAVTPTPTSTSVLVGPANTVSTVAVQQPATTSGAISANGVPSSGGGSQL